MLISSRWFDIWDMKIYICRFGSTHIREPNSTSVHLHVPHVIRRQNLFETRERRFHLELFKRGSGGEKACSFQLKRWPALHCSSFAACLLADWLAPICTLFHHLWHGWNISLRAERAQNVCERRVKFNLWLIVSTFLTTSLDCILKLINLMHPFLNETQPKNRPCSLLQSTIKRIRHRLIGWRMVDGRGQHQYVSV